MRVRFLLSLTFILVLSACGALPGSNPDKNQVPGAEKGITITFPSDGSDIYVAQDPSDQYFYWHWTPGYITLSVDVLPRTNDPACPYAPLNFVLYDNGGPFRGEAITPVQKECTAVAPSQEASYSWDPDTLGLHTLTAELVITPGDGTQRIISSNSITVCVLNDPLRPVRSIPVGSVSADCDPTLVKVTPVPGTP